MLIIPAIDLYRGKAVRLTRGEYGSSKEYSADPVGIASDFFDAGFSLLHVVDLDGAKEGRMINVDVIRRIIALGKGSIEVGGGIRTRHDIESMLTAGAVRVILGSIAVSRPDKTGDWLREFGSDSIVIGLDLKGGRIAHSGWLQTAAQSVNTFIADMIGSGARTFICTDVEKDGMLAGPNLALYGSLVRSYADIEIIASGGISSLEDIESIRRTGVAGVIVGKAIYENKISLESLHEYELKKGIKE